MRQPSLVEPGQSTTTQIGSQGFLIEILLREEQHEIIWNYLT